MPLNLHKDEEITIDEFKEYDFDPLEVKPISKKNLVIFFLVDTSGSMSGKKIGTLNTTMEELLPELRGLGGTGLRLFDKIANSMPASFSAPIQRVSDSSGSLWLLGASVKSRSESNSFTPCSFKNSGVTAS